MLRLIEITTWALGGLIVGVLAGYGVAALTRCPRDDRANARPDVDGKRAIPFRRMRQDGHRRSQRERTVERARA